MRTVQPTFILDCSPVMASYFDDETSNYANRVMDTAEKEGAAVPALWQLEIANSLLIAERRKRTTVDRMQRWVEAIEELPISVDPYTTNQALNKTLHIARAYNLTSYDAAYLELAQRLNLPLATLDKKMKEAAKKAGISLFQ
jgi:predicted nucleic acid-binding protein